MDQTLSPKQQAVDLITRAQDILIVSHRNPDGDSLGSTLALSLILEKIGKKTTMACPDVHGQIFSFLPKISDILQKINTSKDLVISVDLKNAKLGKLGYKKIEKENKVEILITPGDGRFEESDVSSQIKGAKYDLIISLDTPNLERLGSLAEPADVFYEVPVINIDHHPANERFGKVNWVELVATSTAEVLVSLIEALGKDKPLLDEQVATCLLTGLIYDTSSFQNVNTTPKSLTVAAQLVAAGAKQQEIIKNLYKTKSLETLKLWGVILQKVQEDKEGRFIYSAVNKEEIQETGSDEGAIGGILDELLKSATDVDFALLLSEREGQVHGSLRSIAKGVDVSAVADLFGGGGHEVAAAFRVEGNLIEKQELILSKIRSSRASGDQPKSEVEEKVEEKVEAKPTEEPKSEVVEEGKPAEEKPAEEEPKPEVIEEKAETEKAPTSEVAEEEKPKTEEKPEMKEKPAESQKDESEPKSELKPEVKAESTEPTKGSNEDADGIFSFSTQIPKSSDAVEPTETPPPSPPPETNSDSLTKW
ncbi:MAG: bifunctional oligoribonuclease/PAP phosphatase NrnA [bacterium]